MARRQHLEAIYQQIGETVLTSACVAVVLVSAEHSASGDDCMVLGSH